MDLTPELSPPPEQLLAENNTHFCVCTCRESAIGGFEAIEGIRTCVIFTVCVGALQKSGPDLVCHVISHLGAVFWSIMLWLPASSAFSSNLSYSYTLNRQHLSTLHRNQQHPALSNPWRLVSITVKENKTRQVKNNSWLKGLTWFLKMLIL